MYSHCNYDCTDERRLPPMDIEHGRTVRQHDDIADVRTYSVDIRTKMHTSDYQVNRSNKINPSNVNLSRLITSNSYKTHNDKSTSAMINDLPSRLNQFSWEEIEGRYIPVIFRYVNMTSYDHVSIDCLVLFVLRVDTNNTSAINVTHRNCSLKPHCFKVHHGNITLHWLVHFVRYYRRHTRQVN
jgi:hypothetical protein